MMYVRVGVPRKDVARKDVSEQSKKTLLLKVYPQPSVNIFESK